MQNYPDVNCTAFRNMDHPQVSYRITDVARLIPREPNLVFIKIETKSDKILHDPNTGQRILMGSTLLPRSGLTSLSLCSSSNPDNILSLLLDETTVNYCWLCGYLAPVISREANRLGFGGNGFTFIVHVTITYQTLLIPMHLFKEAVCRMVLHGRIDTEELKTLKMETEPCSICLQSLSGYKRPTRMTCSHVFHDQCLVEWLYRKNTCPLCRTVLYHP